LRIHFAAIDHKKGTSQKALYTKVLTDPEFTCVKDVSRFTCLNKCRQKGLASGRACFYWFCFPVAGQRFS
jgi:hypothetical protein